VIYDGRESVQLLGVSSSALFWSGSVPNKVFYLLSSKFFLSGVLHCFFSGSNIDLSVFPHMAQSLLTEIFYMDQSMVCLCSLTRIFYLVFSKIFYTVFSLVILTWASPHSKFYNSVKLDFYDFSVGD
jgi:hypothetical protein